MTFHHPSTAFHGLPRQLLLAEALKAGGTEGAVPGAAPGGAAAAGGGGAPHAHNHLELAARLEAAAHATAEGGRTGKAYKVIACWLPADCHLVAH